MRVLQICLKPPLPELDGGCKAMNNITQGLITNNVEVKVLTLSTPKHPFKKEALSNQYIKSTGIENVHIDTSVKPLEAFFNLFSTKSYNIERFYSIQFEKLIENTLKQKDYDVVLLESLYVTKYINSIKKKSKAKIIYRAHNIESEIWQRNASQTKGFKKNYINLLAQRLKQYEQTIINQFDGIAAITEKDKLNFKKLGCTIPVEVFPFGISMDNYPLTTNADLNTLFHIGSMDWLPNQLGIKWFLDNVWNNVVERFPEAKLNLAGKNMPVSFIKHKQQHVNILGEVTSANNFINQNEIMIVPLLVGSGMRIKIIEGMALEKLVIATTVAAEGISYTDKENIIIANTPDEFISAIVFYLKNKDEQKRIAKNARELIRRSYDNQLIVNNLVTFFKQRIN